MFDGVIADLELFPRARDGGLGQRATKPGAKQTAFDRLRDGPDLDFISSRDSTRATTERRSR